LVKRNTLSKEEKGGKGKTKIAVTNRRISTFEEKGKRKLALKGRQENQLSQII